MTPFVTIVTATLNRRVLLERALASAMREGIEGVQHVVVDGGSTDGTVELLSAYPHLEVISEPDRNLYDAWNKGIARARGEFIFILNSDDEIAPGALAEARRMATFNPRADMISGAVALVHAPSGSATHTVIIDDPRMVGLREQDVGPGLPLTNGRFLRRRFVEMLGRFDTRYPVLADRQFFLRAVVAGAINVRTDALIYCYHVHNDALTLNDMPPSILYAKEAVQICIDGMNEALTADAYAAYRRWHAWASFYLAYLETRSGQFGASKQTIWSAMAFDKALPLRLVPQLLRHVGEMRARRGRPMT